MSSSIIPLDVLTDIFCWLPVDALLRFRSLWKTCCSLIYAVDLDSSDMCPVKLKNVKSVPGEFHVIGSSNGLIALKIGEKTSLWNPCTRKRQFLPLSVKPNQISYMGFGYDAISDDYKVIIIKPDSNQNHRRVLIYSLKTNSSRNIDFDLDHNDVYKVRYNYTMCVFVGGCLNWIYRRRGNKRSRILAFDLGKEKFKDLMMPDAWRHHPVTSFAELGGCLMSRGHYSLLQKRAQKGVQRIRLYAQDIPQVYPMWDVTAPMANS